MAKAPYQVQGGNASSYEYNIAEGLYKIDLPFIFQYELLGGRRFRGGMIIDFLILTRPLTTPLFVNGDYWHRNSEKEYQQKLIVEQELRGQANPVLIAWGKDCSTPGDALSFLRAKLLV